MLIKEESADFLDVRIQDLKRATRSKNQKRSKRQKLYGVNTEERSTRQKPKMSRVNSYSFASIRKNLAQKGAILDSTYTNSLKHESTSNSIELLKTPRRFLSK